MHKGAWDITCVDDGTTTQESSCSSRDCCSASMSGSKGEGLALSHKLELACPGTSGEEMRIEVGARHDSAKGVWRGNFSEFTLSHLRTPICLK
ncbi:MAG: hypothetical protein H0M93_00290 [Methanophagales archaeon]|nr:hypothetical protein [Methanophagales archaeon]